MKTTKCQKCEEPIPKVPEIWVGGKKVCERCYWKFKYEMVTANHLYKKYGDLELYDKLLNNSDKSSQNSFKPKLGRPKKQAEQKKK